MLEQKTPEVVMEKQLLASGKKSLNTPAPVELGKSKVLEKKKEEPEFEDYSSSVPKIRHKTALYEEMKAKLAMGLQNRELASAAPKTVAEGNDKDKEKEKAK